MNKNRKNLPAVIPSVRWTKEMDKVVSDHIGDNPQNLEACFELAGTALNKSMAAVRSRYYTHIISNPDNKITATTNRKGVVTFNRKNAPRKALTVVDDFDPIVEVMTNLSKKLTARQKADFVNMLFADK